MLPPPFDLPFVQRGVAEVLLLSFAAGLVGTWIVLRGLAFFAHGLATATFPGLVLADGLGVSASLGALVAGLVFAAGAGAMRPDAGDDRDAATALTLVGALALGVILASDVFHSTARVEALLFGSLLLLQPSDLLVAAGASALALLATWRLGPRWLAAGFDPGAAPGLGLRRGADVGLLLLIALVTTAVLAAVGALLAVALTVVPAATTRLWTRRMRSWQAAAVALAAAEGFFGLWISVELNAPPGATIAVLGGAVFALAAGARVLVRSRHRAAAAATAVAALALAAAVSGCAGSADAGGRPVVVATTTQLGDFARTVGGDTVAVHQILQPGTDPHEYEPRPADVIATAHARLILESGDGLDAWAADIVRGAGSDAPVVDVGTAVPIRRTGANGDVDPHWWHDPRNAEAATRTIARALAQADPAHRALYARRAAAYVRRLRALDRSLARCLGAIPAPRRVMVTSHDALGYLAARYGIRVVGTLIPAQSTEAQPSAGDLSHLVDEIHRFGVRAIFPESSVSPALAHAVAARTGARSDLKLYGDALGPSGTRTGTYLGMERVNGENLVEGLTGRRVRCR